MSRLIPEKIEGDVNINLNVTLPTERISSAITNIIWTACLASIARNRLRRK